jgi:prolyl oligopeptidase
VRRSLSLSLPFLVACGASGATQAPSVTAAPATPSATAAPPATQAAVTGPTKPAYPPTAKRPVVDLYRDVRVADDFRWLEDGKDPNVQSWSEAENTFARKALDDAPGRAAMHGRVAHLMSDSSAAWGGLVARKGTFFALEQRPSVQHPTLVVLASIDGPLEDGSKKRERVLLDPNALDPSGGTAIGWFVPSPDGKRVAVSLSKGGSERGDVHVIDVATAKEGKDIVPQSDGAGNGNCLAWKGDGSGFFYTHGAREPDASGAPPENGTFQRVYFHKLGDPIEKDVLAVGKDSPRIAQWELAAGGDGRSTVARMEYGDGGEFEQWVLGPSGAWQHVATKDDDIKEMAVGPDGALYLLSAKNAPKRRLLRTSLASPSLDKAEVILPEGDAVIESFLPAKSRIYVVEVTGGPSRVRSVSLDKGGKAGKGEAVQTLATPPVSKVDDLSLIGGDVALEITSYTEPPGWYRARGKDGAISKTALVSTSVADYKDVAVTREECTSKDGTKVPLTVLRPKSAVPDGRAPALLTGYGGFGITEAPRFRPQILAWLEQGGIYAVANLRGGGEFGDAWHAAGNLTNKQNVFDDFYACAQHLVETKDTSPERLAILGGSNGGLLMGAEITQHPEAFKAVVSSVGIYDMLRVERDPNGAFNTTEYGSVTDPKQFDALFAYSPYHHVKDGVAYPAVLFMTGANDPRVAPYHSRKMVARLQDATSSDAPVLLRTSANTGHGVGSPLSARVEEWTDMFAFLFRQLGVTYTSK